MIVFDVSSKDPKGFWDPSTLRYAAPPLKKLSRPFLEFLLKNYKTRCPDHKNMPKLNFKYSFFSFSVGELNKRGKKFQKNFLHWSRGPKKVKKSEIFRVAKLRGGLQKN